jgi:hypothetical protein
MTDQVSAIKLAVFLTQEYLMSLDDSTIDRWLDHDNHPCTKDELNGLIREVRDLILQSRMKYCEMENYLINKLSKGD